MFDANNEVNSNRVHLHSYLSLWNFFFLFFGINLNDDVPASNVNLNVFVGFTFSTHFLKIIFC